jgi:hypothetical protein
VLQNGESASKRRKLPEQGIENNHKAKKLARPDATVVVVLEALGKNVTQKRQIAR